MPCQMHRKLMPYQSHTCTQYACYVNQVIYTVKGITWYLLFEKFTEVHGINTVLYS